MSNLNAQELNQQGLNYLEGRHYDRALLCFEKAANLFAQQKDWGNSAQAVNNQGDINRLINLYTESIRNWHNAIQLYGKAGERSNIAKINLKLGYLYLKLGEYIHGREHLETALADFQNEKFLQGQSWANAYLGLLHHQIDDDEVALVHNRLALRITQEIGDHETHADALVFQGHSLVHLKQFVQARGAYDYALSLLANIGERGLKIDVLAGLARLEYATQNQPEANEYVDKILIFIETLGIERAIEPVRTMLTCYTILKSAGDPRSSIMLENSHFWLMQKADQLSDSSMRRKFLENIAAHRSALQLWTHARMVSQP